MVDGSGLENRQAERPRGFESHPLRHIFRDQKGQILKYIPAGSQQIRTPFDRWGAERKG